MTWNEAMNRRNFQRRHSARRRCVLLWATLATMLFMFPGCGGCGDDPNKNANNGNLTEEEKQKAAEEQKKAEEEKKLEEEQKDFDVGELRTIPSSRAFVGAFVKPGHWTVASIDVTANKFDVPNGEISTQPLKLDGMPFSMGSSREALLSKGEEKSLTTTLYVPPGRATAPLDVSLTRRGAMLERKAASAARMPAHQFHFLVLSATPDQYLYLSRLYSIRPFEYYENVQQEPYFRIHIPDLSNESLPLPDNSLCWTSTAYLLWDGLPPNTLNLEQQTALVDWLHWGGQLIISGPASLDLLKDSFLADYLPAQPGRDITLSNADVAGFGAEWEPRGAARDDRPLDVPEDISAKELVVDELDPAVHVLSSTRLESGEDLPMVVERTIGRGRVVATTFGLTQKEFLPPAWTHFDNFFNACLLRRPGREFSTTGQFGYLSAHWRDGESVLDPRLQSRVRYFSRDAQTSSQAVSIDGEPVQGFEGVLVDDANDGYTFEETDVYGVSNRTIGPGVAGWSDFNIASAAARETLRKAAGIVVPEADFVLKMIGLYVLVLVGVNWLLFRLVGRLEWAWVAAPIITIAFAMIVVNQANLDIGFRRARTEVNIVELHGDYARAHVTRYSALYTSLATEYETRFSDSTALVQPFARLGAHETRRALIGETPTTVHYHRSPSRVTLTGFEVASNATEILHAEHMLDLGGGIQLAGFDGVSGTIVNNTEMDLHGAAILHTDGGAWIGDVAAGAEARFRLQSGVEETDWFAERDEAPQTDLSPGSVDLDLRPLMQLLEARGRHAEKDTFPDDELRLVAWNEDALPGMQIEPSASNVRYGNVIVAHLRHPELEPPSSNANTPTSLDIDREYLLDGQ